MDELEEIIKEFLVESYENLDQLDRDLLALEDAPDDRKRLSSVFRTIHTIKGTCGFLGFPILEHVAHVGESLLVRLRDGELRLDGAITTGLLAMVDAVRTMLTNITQTKTEGENHYESLVEVLDQLRLGQVPQPVAVVAVVAVAEHATSGANFDFDSSGVKERVEATVDDLDAMVVELTETPSTASSSKASSKKSRKPTVAKAKPAAKSQATKSPKRSSKQTVAPAIETATVTSIAMTAQAAIAAPIHAEPLVTAASLLPAEKSMTTQNHNATARASGISEPASLSEPTDKGQAVAETTVRLDVALLDKLMNLVGELVLVRNQILQYSRSTEDASLITASQRLNLITSELQEGGNEDADAADSECVGQAAACRARSLDDLRKEGADQDGGGRDGTRQDDPRGDSRSADAHRAELGGSRDRSAGRPRGQREAGRGNIAVASLPRGRAGQHRDLR